MSLGSWTKFKKKGGLQRLTATTECNLSILDLNFYISGTRSFGTPTARHKLEFIERFGDFISFAAFTRITRATVDFHGAYSTINVRDGTGQRNNGLRKVFNRPMRKDNALDTECGAIGILYYFSTRTREVIASRHPWFSFCNPLHLFLGLSFPSTGHLTLSRSFLGTFNFILAIACMIRMRESIYGSISGGRHIHICKNTMRYQSREVPNAALAQARAEYQTQCASPRFNFLVMAFSIPSNVVAIWLPILALSHPASGTQMLN